MEETYSIEFRNVDKSFGKTDVIKDLNLQVKKGERLILLGPSGCGKSTILRIISGLEGVSSGELYLRGSLANDIDSGDRSIAMVFQNYALFPHMTVENNIAYGLQVNRIPADEIRSRVAEVVETLNLQQLEKRLPRELSGGQRQRVALARAIVKRADFLLLDEPLSNLDAQLRGTARKELVKLHELYQQTFVYVTHDQIEAMTIGHRIALVHEGRLQMLDTPYNVYHHPANIFVATFIGSPSMNILPVAREGSTIHTGRQSFSLATEWAEMMDKHSGELLMGIRPEDIVLQKEEAENSLQVTIRYIEDYGNRVGFYFELGDHEMISIMPENIFSQGEVAYWPVPHRKLHFFDGKSTLSLGYPASVKEG